MAVMIPNQAFIVIRADVSVTGISFLALAFEGTNFVRAICVDTASMRACRTFIDINAIVSVTRKPTDTTTLKRSKRVRAICIGMAIMVVGAALINILAVTTIAIIAGLAQAAI